MQAIVLNREIAQGIFCDRALREELIKLLNALIDEELRKTDDEADFDLIDAYSEALNDLYGENGTLHVIRKLQTADAFLARVSENKKWQSINRAVKAGLAVCAALAFLVTANTVTEKATGVNVLGRAAEAVRNIFVGQEREPIITLPPETERAVTERVSEVASETTAQETEKESTGEPSAAASAVGQTQPNRSPTTTGAQSTVKPKNPNLQQVLSPEDPPTTKAHETTTRKPFERDDEDETAAPCVIKLSASYSEDFKRDYKVGEPIDLRGLTVTATYDNGSTKQIPASACSIHGFSTETPANRIVTIEYEGCSFSYLIKVQEEA